jgi:hypothetical protein
VHAQRGRHPDWGQVKSEIKISLSATSLVFLLDCNANPFGMKHSNRWQFFSSEANETDSDRDVSFQFNETVTEFGNIFSSRINIHWPDRGGSDVAKLIMPDAIFPP